MLPWFHHSYNYHQSIVKVIKQHTTMSTCEWMLDMNGQSSIYNNLFSSTPELLANWHFEDKQHNTSYRNTTIILHSTLYHHYHQYHISLPFALSIFVASSNVDALSWRPIFYFLEMKRPSSAGSTWLVNLSKCARMTYTSNVLISFNETSHAAINNAQLNIYTII